VFPVAVAENLAVSSTEQAKVNFVASLVEQARLNNGQTASVQFVASVLERIGFSDAEICRFLWELIDDAQLPNWNGFDTDGLGNWTLIDSSQASTVTTISAVNTFAGGAEAEMAFAGAVEQGSTNGGWQGIDTLTYPGWDDIDTDTPPNWTEIDTV
jgi:hypothetical protein